MRTKYLSTRAFIIMAMSMHIGFSKAVEDDKSGLALVPRLLNEECDTDISYNLIQRIKIKGDIKYLNGTIDRLLEKLKIRKLKVPNPIPDIKGFLNNLPGFISIRKTVDEIKDPALRMECSYRLFQKVEHFSNHLMVDLVRSRFDREMSGTQQALSKSRKRIDDVAYFYDRNDGRQECNETHKEMNEVMKELESIDSFMKLMDQDYKEIYENFIRNNLLYFTSSLALTNCL